MRRLLPLLALALIGCHRSREGEVVGTWRINDRIAYAFDAAKTYKVNTGRITMDGTWSVDGDKVSVVQTTVNGQPIAQVKAGLEKNRSQLTPALQSVVDGLGQPQVYTLAADGKSMSRVGTTGKTITMTKS